MASAATVQKAAAAASMGMYAQYERDTPELRHVRAAQGTDLTQKYDVFGTNSYPAGENQWAAFFGSPASPWKTTSYDKYDRNNWNLPDAYVGKNETLAQTITELIYTEETFYTGILLPLKYSEDLHIAWDKWEFNQHFTGVVPEQGISRLVVSSRERQTDSLLRRGIGFSAEHGFMSTPEGRAHYYLTLAQIARAVRETNNFGVIYALLTCHRYNKEYEAKHGYMKNSTVREILAWEHFTWAVTIKAKNGFEKLDAQANERVAKFHKNVELDTWVIPPKPAVYLRLAPAEKTDHYLAGPMGPDRVNNIVGSGRPHEGNAKRVQDMVEPYALFNKNRVFLTRMYDVAKRGAVDLMSRVSTLGEYFKIIPLDGNFDFRNDFQSRYTDTRIYDEDNCKGHTVNMLEGIRDSQVFQADGTPAPVNISPFVSDNDWRQCFFLRNRNEQIGYMGEIDKEFLRPSDALNIGYCLARTFAGEADKEGAMTKFTQSLRDVARAAAAAKAAGGNVPQAAEQGEGDLQGAMPVFSKAPEALQEALHSIANVVSTTLGGSANLFGSTGERLYDTLITGNMSNVYRVNGAVGSSISGGNVLTPKSHEYALGGLTAEGRRALTSRPGTDLSTKTYANTVAIADFLESNMAYTRATSQEGLSKWVGELREYAQNEVSENRNRQSAASAAGVTYTPTGLKIAADHPSVLDGTLERKGFTIASHFAPDQPAEIGSSIARPGASTGFMNSLVAREILGAEAANRRQPVDNFAGETSDYYGSGLDEMFSEGVGTMFGSGKERDARIAGITARAANVKSADIGNDNIRVLASNVDDLNKLTADPVAKVMAALFYGAPWNFNTFEAMYGANVVLPVGLLGFRLGRYDMALGIKMKAGLSTGATYFMKSRFELGDDSVIQMHYGNLTHYGKSIVHRPENVLVIYDIFPNGCLGGMGVRHYTNPDQYQPGQEVRQADIFFVMVPFRETTFDTAMSIAGRFYTYMDAGLLDEADPNNREMHYSTAAFYNSIWKWYSPEVTPDEVDEPLYRLAPSSHHQVIWQGAQGTYNPQARDFTKDIIRCRSPWGPKVVAGHTRDARDGLMEIVPDVPANVLGF